MTGLFQTWGRSVPQDMRGKIAVTWGARAIYTRCIIDLLPDRQHWHVQGFSEDDADPTSVEYENRRARMRPLMAWINRSGLPFLRKAAKTLHPDECRVVSLDDGLFHIEASPQSSCGYLYIRAWEIYDQSQIHPQDIDTGRARPQGNQFVPRQGLRNRRQA